MEMVVVVVVGIEKPKVGEESSGINCIDIATTFEGRLVGRCECKCECWCVCTGVWAVRERVSPRKARQTNGSVGITSIQMRWW